MKRSIGTTHEVGGTTSNTDVRRGRRTYNVTEVAEILGISRTTAYECVRSGQLPALKLRGRIVVPIASVEAMLTGSRPADA